MISQEEAFRLQYIRVKFSALWKRCLIITNNQSISTKEFAIFCLVMYVKVMGHRERFCYDNVNIKLSIFTAPFSKLAFSASCELSYKGSRNENLIFSPMFAV